VFLAVEVEERSDRLFPGTRKSVPAVRPKSASKVEEEFKVRSLMVTKPSNPSTIKVEELVTPAKVQPYWSKSTVELALLVSMTSKVVEAAAPPTPSGINKAAKVEVAVRFKSPNRGVLASPRSRVFLAVEVEERSDRLFSAASRVEEAKSGKVTKDVAAMLGDRISR
jgi:hypothetical protein